jgi:hypothetical protein
MGAIRYLGGQVVAVEPLFGKMACMRNVEREEYALLEILKEIFPNAPKFHRFVNLMQRIVQVQGMAMWPRTELTDLSAKAQTSPYRQKKNIGDMPTDLNTFMEAMEDFGGSEEILRSSSDQEESQ